MGRSQGQALNETIESAWGGLADFWYPLCLSRAIATNTTQAVTAFGISFLVWRNAQGAVSVFPDSCPHRHAPLSQGQIVQQQLQCPYHGWRFDHHGRCQEIPVLPEQPCEGIVLHQLPSVDDGQIVWFYPGDPDGDRYGDFSPKLDVTHRANYLVQDTFECDVDALLDNFMDSPHTRFVHNGLIRQASVYAPRTIKIVVDRHGQQKRVSVHHDPVQENIGIASRLFNPEGNPVRHCDRFISPNELEITYSFHDEVPEFKTQIFLCPIDPQHTRAFISIACKFPHFNALAQWGIRLLAPIVLKQDKHILQLQSQNSATLPKFEGYSTAYDAVYLKIKNLRLQEKYRDETAYPVAEKTMSLKIQV